MAIGDERAAGALMREVQEHGEGARPLRFTGDGKGLHPLLAMQVVTVISG